MNKLLFSTISKEYEKSYNLLVSKGISSVETIKLLNDAILFPFIVEKGLLGKYILNKDVNIYDVVNLKYLFSNKEVCQQTGDDFWNILSFFSCVISTLENSDETIQNILGSVLEKHINRKATGSYYTPNDTTKYITWNAIFINAINNLNKEIKNKILSIFNLKSAIELLQIQMPIEQKISIISSNLTFEEKNKLSKVVKGMKIIDPTCGSGAFIIQAIDFLNYLNNTILNNQLSAKNIFNTIYGLDISEEAVLLTKMRCIINMYKSNDFESWFFDVFNSNFVVADALSGKDYVIDTGNGFDWKTFSKFDCIIGNPPYVESKSKITNRFITKKCGNLYAYIIERACNIINKKGIISFIVPLPLIATARMEDVRNYLHKCSSAVYYSTYADRPGCLFTGVHQRLTIFFAQIGDTKNTTIKTSKYHYWYNGERKTLFDNIEYFENKSDEFPKVGNLMEYTIFNKINNESTSLYEYFDSNSDESLWVSTRIGFWTKAFMHEIRTNELKKYCIRAGIRKEVIYCLLNSSIFYYFWILTSDCWHVTNLDLKRFKFNYNALSEDQISSLCSLASQLNRDLEKNKVKIDTKQTIYEYKHKYSKHIIDLIDDIIATVYNLNNEEIDYVKNYTLKYRLNTYHKEV